MSAVTFPLYIYQPLNIVPMEWQALAEEEQCATWLFWVSMAAFSKHGCWTSIIVDGGVASDDVSNWGVFCTVFENETSEEVSHEDRRECCWLRISVYRFLCGNCSLIEYFCYTLHTPVMHLGHSSPSSFVPAFSGHLCLWFSYYPVSQHFVTFFFKIFNKLLNWHLLGN